jgi:serine/threonine protein kinase
VGKRCQHPVHRADQFAVAVMAYEMLSCRMPFEGDSVTDVLNKIVHRPPRSLLEVAPLLPEAVWDVLARGLAKKPEARFDTMSELAVALARASGLLLSLPPYSKTPFAFSHPPVVPAIHSARMPTVSSPPTITARPPRPVSAPRPPAEPDPAASLEEVRRELDRFRRSMAFAESGEAYSAAHAAVSVAYGKDIAEARELVEASSKVLESVFERKLRGPQGKVLLLQLPGPTDMVVAPQQVYLLTRLEDQSTLDEVLDLSPLSRLGTMWLLACCLDSGLIAIR